MKFMFNGFVARVVILVCSAYIYARLIHKVKIDLHEQMEAFCSAYEKKLTTQTRVTLAGKQVEYLEEAVGVYLVSVPRRDTDDLRATITRMHDFSEKLVSDLRAVDGKTAILSPHLNSYELHCVERAYGAFNDSCDFLESFIKDMHVFVGQLKSVGPAGINTRT